MINRFNVWFFAVVMVCSVTQQSVAEEIVDFETRYFSVQAVQGLSTITEPLINEILDQCAEDTGLLAYRVSTDRIPFFLARGKQTLDHMIDEFYEGQISLTQDTYVERKFCGEPANGSMFVTGGTISLCVGNEAFWAEKIQANKFCPDIVHEMVHIVQNELAGGGFRAPGQPLTEVVGPAWLFEGVAVLIRYIQNFDSDQLNHIVRLTRDRIPHGSLAISEMEDFERRDDYQKIHYLKGFIAAKFLLDRNNEEAFFSFYRCLGNNDNWEKCFWTSFGISIEEFYSIRSLR